MPGQDTGDKRQAAREVIDILHEIATLLVSHFPHRVNVNTISLTSLSEHTPQSTAAVLLRLTH